MYLVVNLLKIKTRKEEILCDSVCVSLQTNLQQELEDSVAQKMEEYEQLKSALQQKEEEIVTHQQTIQEKDEEIAGLNLTLDEKVAELDNVSKELTVEMEKTKVTVARSLSSW